LLYTAINAKICACAPPPWKSSSRIQSAQIPGTVESLLVRLQTSRNIARGSYGSSASWAIVAWNARLETVFLDRIHDPDETTRTYAVIGLGLLATDSSIAPFLLFSRGSLATPRVREGAACAHRASGMFREEQRMGRRPDLLR